MDVGQQVETFILKTKPIHTTTTITVNRTSLIFLLQWRSS